MRRGLFLFALLLIWVYEGAASAQLIPQLTESYTTEDGQSVADGSVEPSAGVTETATEIRLWANYATGSSQYGEQGWSFMQASGEPDAGDVYGGSWNEIDAVELIGAPECAAVTVAAPTKQTAIDSAEPTEAPANTGTIESRDLDISEYFSFDGENHISLNYPVGWVTDVSQLPAIASSEKALAALQRGAPLPEGGIAIGIIPPKDMPAALGLTPADSASETLSNLADLFGVMDVEMGPYEGLIYPAFSAPLTGTRMPPPNTHVLTVEHGNGVVTFLIVTQSLNNWRQLIEEMVASLSMW